MKLSIVTINYNNADGLRKTMESVFAQTYRDFEYIVVDGASTDGSVDVIKELEKLQMTNDQSQISFSWISEKDSGLYNAMNKGIEIASGRRVVDAFNRSELVEDKNKGIEISSGKRVVNVNHKSQMSNDKSSKTDGDVYLIFLNSGDYFVNEHVVERILPELDGTDYIQGNIIVRKDGQEQVRRGYGKSDITFIDVMCGNFLHLASFFRRTLFDKYGYFDEDMRINSDTVFTAKCLGFGDATFKYVDQNISYYDITGISADPEGKYRKIRDEEDARYAQMFSPRMWDLYHKEQKKIQLYNKLHAHKWSWYLTMAVARLVSILYRNS